MKRGMFGQLFVASLLLLADSITAKHNPNAGHHKDGKNGGANAPAPPLLDKKFLTLNGGHPEVVAQGGYSGLFPDSSKYAYDFALQMSLPDSIMYCNLQLTKDNFAFCAKDIRIDVSTTVTLPFPKGEKTYNVNGRDIRGWFAMDYTLEELKNTTFYVQDVLTRTNAFDGVTNIFTPDELAELKVKRMWLNVEYDMFYVQHKLSAARYIEESTQYWVPSHISSPEIDFLKYMSGKVDKANTKLILKFLGKEDVEPTTRQKYGLILNDLATIKPFVSGILVPKDYIIPITNDNYTDVPTTLVADAHKLGLEVYTYGFLNDDKLPSYNYSYDPINEYLQFIDNSQFSVDGVITEFPSTASSSIACFAQSKNLTSKIVKGLVISHNGASGDYPGSTDLAYQKAIDDGADIIDCSVQMSQDGVAFCSSNVDLTATTTALAAFMDRSSSVPEIQPNNGIFSFDLTWSEIESLKPTIENPVRDVGLFRNPKNKNKGKFVTLAAFLELAKTKKTGVLINVENAAYLASKKGLGLVDTVAKALQNASFDKQSTQKVMIQSDDSAVLSAFKNVPTYQRVLEITDVVSDAPPAVVEEIKRNADGVVIDRYSIIQKNSGSFTSGSTKIIDEMHAANISVYVSCLRNEYIFLSFDYLSDPYLELATFASLKVDGVITDFPATASAFMRNPCSDSNNPNNVLPIAPIKPGLLAQQVDPAALPPALPPSPVLENADVVDPPLPPVTKKENAAPASAPTKDQNSGAPKIVSNLGIITSVVTLFFGLLSFF